MGNLKAERQLQIEDDYYRKEGSNRKSHNKTYKPLPALVDPYKYSFFARCIPVWNSLPLEAVDAQSIHYLCIRLL